ncbi:MAG: oligosaccharide flippase family protein [Sedimentibacter sp.]
MIDKRQISLIWLGTMIGASSVFIINIIIARSLSVSEFGTFSTIYSIATMSSIVASFGFSQFLLNVFGKDGWEALNWLRPFFKSQFILLSIVLLTIFIWAYMGPNDKSTRLLIVIMSLYGVSQVMTEITVSKLQLEENFSVLALTQATPNLSRLIIFVVLFYFSNITASVLNVAVVYAISSIAVIIFCFHQINRFKGNKLKLKGHLQSAPTFKENYSVEAVFKKTWPYGLASLFAFIYVQIDIMMVKYISGSNQAGLYSVAYNFFAASTLLPNVLYQKYLLPKYHRWSNSDIDKLREAYKYGYKAMLSFGIGIMILIVILSNKLVPLVFGFRYANSVVLVNIISIAIPISYLAYNAGAILATEKYIKVKVFIMAITAVINMLLNIILIPLLSGIGAAISSIISYLVLFAMYSYVVHKKILRMV